MTAETWTIIGTGIVILVAIATSNRSMRSEMRAEIKELHTEVHDLDNRFGVVETTLTERMNRLEVELRERLARIEGMLEGIRDSILGRTV